MTHKSNGRPRRRQKRLPFKMALRFPGRIHQEEEMSNTKLETGSAQIQDVGTRTLPGEQNATNVKPKNLKVVSHQPFHCQVVTVAEVTLWHVGRQR